MGVLVSKSYALLPIDHEQYLQQNQTLIARHFVDILLKRVKFCEYCCYLLLFIDSFVIALYQQSMYRVSYYVASLPKSRTYGHILLAVQQTNFTIDITRLDDFIFHSVNIFSSYHIIREILIMDLLQVYDSDSDSLSSQESPTTCT